jgi:hypothetical protein
MDTAEARGSWGSIRGVVVPALSLVRALSRGELLQLGARLATTAHTKSARATEDGRSHVTRFFAVCR